MISLINKNFLLFILLFLINHQISFGEINDLGKTQYLPLEAKFCLNKNCIFLEVAETREEQSKGLMYRKTLRSNSGMLFLLDKARIINIWMKNTFVPLDVIFLINNKIVKIYENIQPCKIEKCQEYSSVYKINKIIEVASGTVKKLSLKEGQILNIENY